LSRVPGPLGYRMLQPNVTAGRQSLQAFDSLICHDPVAK